MTGGRQSRFGYEGKEHDTNGFIPLNGLVSYYSFNDGTSDEVLGNNGVAINATKTTGFVRDAYYLRGNTSYILINDSSSLDMNASLTLSAWIYPVKNVQGYVVAKTGSYMIQFTGTTLQGGIWNGGGWNALTTSGTVPLNTWTHVTFTYNRSDAILYINGAINTSNTSTNYINVTNNPLIIGARNDNTRLFNGTIDEVGVWNRAITSSEAKILYDYGKNYDANPSTDFHARMLSGPQFSQPDNLISNIFDPQSLNRYAFERNNPYKNNDPTGHQSLPSSSGFSFEGALSKEIAHYSIIAAVSMAVIGTAIRLINKPVDLSYLDQRSENDYIYEYAYAQQKDAWQKIAEDYLKTAKEMDDIKDLADMTSHDKICDDEGNCHENSMMPIDYGFYPVPHYMLSPEMIENFINNIDPLDISIMVASASSGGRVSSEIIESETRTANEARGHHCNTIEYSDGSTGCSYIL